MAKEELSKPLGQKLEEEDRQLYHRLERLQTIFDFSHAYFNKEVGVLKPGTQFGELALINDAPRAATIYCMQESIFAIIERAEYERVLKRIEIKNQQMKIAFLKSLHFLAHWTTSQIQKVMHSFSEKSFVRNQSVYLQGEDPSLVYVVKEGEFEVLRTITQTMEKSDQSRHTSFRKKYGSKAGSLTRNPKLEEASNVQKNSRNWSNPQNKFIPSQAKVKFLEKQTMDKKGPQSKLIRMTILCSGQIIGDDDVISGRPYTTTVRCTSTTAILYCIKADEFIHKMSKDEKSWSAILKRASQKDQDTTDKVIKNVNYIVDQAVQANAVGPTSVTSPVREQA